MKKGINFLEGGPGKVVDLTEKAGESLEYQRPKISILFHHRFEKKKTIKERRKSRGLVINNQCHAKTVKKVMEKGINFLEGGPGKVVDLTEKAGESLEYQHSKISILSHHRFEEKKQ